MNRNTARQLMDNLPPEWPHPLLPEIRRTISTSRYRIVVLDDDPTGTQTVRDLPVLTHWSVEGLAEELVREYPAFFLLTNSRSLPRDKACRLAEEIGHNLLKAQEQTGIRTIVISRSDSTLRGHFPHEVEAMARVMGKQKLPYLVLPFFAEGGRYTIGDIHYVQERETLVPAAETIFAKDAAFGFHHSDLKQWVEEKSEGRISAENVTAIQLEDIRLGGPARVAELLTGVKPGTACVCNCVSYRDMEVIVAAVLKVEAAGGEFLYRTAASFVRTRTGMDSTLSLLTKDSLINRNTKAGGIFVIGSYVEKTSRQIEALFSRTTITPLEIRVPQLLDAATRDAEVQRVTEEADTILTEGRDVAVYTSRTLVTGDDEVQSLDIGQTVSDSLIEVVKRLRTVPRYLIAKGGITSSDVATKGLGVKRAMVLGQPLPGVPAWQLGPETRFPGMTYIVFPGNVGDDEALVHLQTMLSQQE